MSSPLERYRDNVTGLSTSNQDFFDQTGLPVSPASNIYRPGDGELTPFPSYPLLSNTPTFLLCSPHTACQAPTILTLPQVTYSIPLQTRSPVATTSLQAQHPTWPRHQDTTTWTTARRIKPAAASG